VNCRQYNPMHAEAGGDAAPMIVNCRQYNPVHAEAGGDTA